MTYYLYIYLIITKKMKDYNNNFEENAKEWCLIEHGAVVTYLVLSIDANDKYK